MKNSPSSASSPLEWSAAPRKDIMPPVALTNTTQSSLRGVPYRKLAAAILPKRYELSIVIVGDKASRTLNRRYRKKDTIPNILSFPLSKTEGELFLNMAQARRDAPSFKMPERKFLVYLVIHGLLHLKGLSHGRTMNQAETHFLKRFAA